MSKTLISILSIAALIAVSACSNDKNKTLVPIAGKGGQKAGAGVQKAKLSDAELKRKNLIRGIGQADQIFKQVLSRALNANAPKSLFEGLFSRLKKHGFGQKADLKAFSTECPRYSTLLSQIGTIATAKSYYTVKDVLCDDPKSPAPSKELTAIEIEIDKNTYNFTVPPDRWVGALGTFYLIDQISCTMQIEDSGKLTDLSCKNLGTGLSDDLFTKFDTFEFHSKKAMVVQISTTNFRSDRTKVCGNTPCLTIEVPITGNIKIVEVTPDELDTNTLNPVIPKGTTAVDENQSTNSQPQSQPQPLQTSETADGRVQEHGLEGQDIRNFPTR